MRGYRKDWPPSEWSDDRRRGRGRRPRGERPERVAGYGEHERYRQDDPRERSDVDRYRRRGFVDPHEREWRDPTYGSPEFDPGGAGEERYMGHWYQGGFGRELGEPGSSGVERDRPDPRRGRRPAGPQGWAYGGLGYEPEPAGSFAGVGPKGYRRSDARIREDVCDWLTEDDHVDATDVDVRVEDGVVILSGTISDRASKRRAEDIASHVRGVQDVVNRLCLPRRPEARERLEPSNGGRR